MVHTLHTSVARLPAGLGHNQSCTAQKHVLLMHVDSMYLLSVPFAGIAFSLVMVEFLTCKQQLW